MGRAGATTTLTATSISTFATTASPTQLLHHERVFGEAGAIRILTLKYEKDQIGEDVALLERDIAALQNEIDRLRNDPLMMEKLGRERYGYIYPGDRVLKLVYPRNTD